MDQAQMQERIVLMRYKGSRADIFDLMVKMRIIMDGFREFLPEKGSTLSISPGHIN